MVRESRPLLLSLVLTLAACSSTEPAVASIEYVTGSDQVGAVGEPYEEPFVVRVTDAAGDGSSGVEVTWTVEVGDGVLDGQWQECGDPVVSASGPTDADGYAALPFVPLFIGPTVVSAHASGLGGSPVYFTVRASKPGATLEMVSGDRQETKTGYQLAEPFVVRLVDADGQLVPDVAVSWEVSMGEGSLHWTGCSGRDPAIVRARDDGTRGGPHSSVRYTPRSFGTNIVLARVPGARGSPVWFTTLVTVQVIRLGSPYVVPPAFSPSDVTVPVGATVEFVNDFDVPSRIVSTSEPPGGAPFDSGEMAAHAQLRFVPQVLGTWEYTDLESGLTGTLTASPG